jgi:hypothetical protein
MIDQIENGLLPLDDDPNQTEFDLSEGPVFLTEIDPVTGQPRVISCSFDLP